LEHDVDVLQGFKDRLQEIDAYLDLLDALERQVQKGPPTIGGAPITAQQQKILYSSVYLQLYNLVEATATWCIEAVAEASIEGARWRPVDLAAELRREWIRTTARTHVELNYDHRLNTTVDFCDLLLTATPISQWAIESGGGGNWDDYALEAVTERIGCDLKISSAVKTAAKRRIRDDKGALGLVKHLRNRLAHGDISFEECGDGLTVADLKDIRQRTADYLQEVIVSFQQYIDEYLFISPDRRPGPETGAYI
jgi:hypothetical protein